MVTIVVTLLIAVLLIVFSVNILSKFKFIERNGVEVEGIVFDSQTSSTTDTNVSYPIIRFLTKENDWITEESKIGTIPGLYKSGEKLTVVYENGNPKNFYIKNIKSYSVPYIMISIGVVLIILGILKLIGII